MNKKTYADAEFERGQDTLCDNLVKYINAVKAALVEKQQRGSYGSNLVEIFTQTSELLKKAGSLAVQIKESKKGMNRCSSFRFIMLSNVLSNENKSLLYYLKL